MIDDKLLQILRNYGNRIMVVAQHNTPSELIEEYEAFLRSQYFTVVPKVVYESADTVYTPLVDTMLVINKANPYQVVANPPTSTTIIALDPDIEEVFPGTHAAYYIYHDGQLRPVGNFGTVWTDEQPLTHFKDSLLRGYPELKEFSDEIAIVFVGACNDHNIGSLDIIDIRDEVKKCFSQGYRKIFFWNGDETAQKNSIYKAQRVVEMLKEYAPPSSFFYVSGCMNFDTIYNHFINTYTELTPMVPVPLMSFQLHALAYGKNPGFRQMADDDYVIRLRPKNFLCFNRVPRLHRGIILARLLELRLVHAKSYYSYDPGQPGTEEIRHRADKYTREIEVLDQHKHLFPLVLNRSAERDNPTDVQTEDLRYFRNSYFSLINETAFFTEPMSISPYPDSVFFSEKTFKAFATKHPFILVTTKHSLKYLRKAGYKTFHPYIDETYDDVEDPDTRIDLIVAEVERLCNFTDAEWIEWQQAIQPIVEHNYNIFVNADTLVDTRGSRHVRSHFDI